MQEKQSKVAAEIAWEVLYFADGCSEHRLHIPTDRLPGYMCLYFFSLMTCIEPRMGVVLHVSVQSSVKVCC